jgi:hypothetical protein
MSNTYYTASVTFKFRNAAGELVTKLVTQDVTDEVAEGADHEELTDRVYWKQIHGQFADVEILGGGVEKVQRVAA